MDNNKLVALSIIFICSMLSIVAIAVNGRLWAITQFAMEHRYEQVVEEGNILWKPIIEE